jgi:hypothetical protein
MAPAMNRGNVEYLHQAEIAAPAFGLKLQLIITIHAAGEFERAFAEMQGANALIQL